MTALLGTFVNVKTMADGTPRLVLDLQCTLAEIAALGLIPGTPFGIARITGESSVQPIEQFPTKEPIGPLCKLACQWCKDPEFLSFQGLTDERTARNFILVRCGVESRRELDTDKRAGQLFHNLIRQPFMRWKAES